MVSSLVETILYIVVLAVGLRLDFPDIPVYENPVKVYTGLFPGKPGEFPAFPGLMV